MTVTTAAVGAAAEQEYEQWHARALEELRHEGQGFFLVTRENAESELISGGPEEEVVVSMITCTRARSVYEALLFLEAVQQALDSERARIERFAREVGEID